MPRVMCAMDVAPDLVNIGEWTRENVEQWLMANSGDFSEVVDFRADFSQGDKDWLSEWENEDSELIYCDCMFPCEEIA